MNTATEQSISPKEAATWIFNYKIAEWAAEHPKRMVEILREIDYRRVLTGEADSRVAAEKLHVLLGMEGVYTA